MGGSKTFSEAHFNGLVQIFFRSKCNFHLNFCGITFSYEHTFPIHTGQIGIYISVFIAKAIETGE